MGIGGPIRAPASNRPWRPTKVRRVLFCFPARLQDGPFGTLRPTGINLGSTPSPENLFVPGSTSTAMTSRTSSRSTSALLSNKCAEARFNNSLPISERTRANSAARRHESWWPSLLTHRGKISSQRRRERARWSCGPQVHPPGEPSRRGPIERQLLNERGIGEEEVGDCPLPQDIVTESHAVVSKIPQSLAFQRLDSGRRKLPGIQRFAARKSVFRRRPESPCAIAVVLVFLSVGGFRPLLGHFDFGAHDRRVGGEAGQTGKAEQVPCNLARRMVISEERPQIWAAFRNSSVSASESSSITTGSARPSWLMTSAGNQQGSATPKSRRAVTMTDMPPYCGACSCPG
jgi:hypothetical protein